MCNLLSHLMFKLGEHVNWREKCQILSSIYALPEYLSDWPIGVQKTGLFNYCAEACRVNEKWIVGEFLRGTVVVLGSNDQLFIIAVYNPYRTLFPSWELMCFPRHPLDTNLSNMKVIFSQFKVPNDDLLKMELTWKKDWTQCFQNLLDPCNGVGVETNLTRIYKHPFYCREFPTTFVERGHFTINNRQYAFTTSFMEVLYVSYDYGKYLLLGSNATMFVVCENSVNPRIFTVPHDTKIKPQAFSPSELHVKSSKQLTAKPDDANMVEYYFRTCSGYHNDEKENKPCLHSILNRVYMVGDVLQGVHFKCKVMSLNDDQITIMRKMNADQPQKSARIMEILKDQTPTKINKHQLCALIDKIFDSDDLNVEMTFKANCRLAGSCAEFIVNKHALHPSKEF